MKSIKEECLRYSLLCRVKSDCKDVEEQNENLKEELRKLQKACVVLNSRIVSINWKIQQANFIMDCEKKRQNVLYDVMKIAESKYTAKARDSATEGKEISNLIVSAREKENCTVDAS